MGLRAGMLAGFLAHLERIEFRDERRSIPTFKDEWRGLVGGWVQAGHLVALFQPEDFSFPDVFVAHDSEEAVVVNE